jgi:hypothetical protein
LVAAKDGRAGVGNGLDRWQACDGFGDLGTVCADGHAIVAVGARIEVEFEDTAAIKAGIERLEATQ